MLCVEDFVQRCWALSSRRKSKLIFQRNLHRNFFAMSVIMNMLCLLTRVGCVTSEPTRFDQERSVHTLETQNDETIKYFANNFINETEFYHDLSHILKPRIPGTTGHKEVSKYIVKRMKDLDWDIELDKFIADTPHGKVHMNNVVATLDPAAPRRFVIACHYDSKIMREIFYAATDSAVPCTMMINIASTMDKLLKQHKKMKKRYTLQFIFFDGEEAFVNWSPNDSIYGSRHLAEKWKNQPYREPNGNSDKTTQLHRMDYMMLLDLLGAKDPNIPSFFSNTQDLHAGLQRIESNLHNFGLLENHRGNYFNGKNHWGGIEDDHIPFLNKGVSILHIIPTPFPKVWHTLRDDHSALDRTTISNLNKIFKVFVSQYFGFQSLLRHG